MLAEPQSPRAGAGSDAGISSTELAKNLTGQFAAVDRQYEIIMKRAGTVQGVLAGCLGTDGLEDSLDNLISHLHTCKCH